MFEDSKPYQPVIIIGAGRSGTNMLRDVLCRLPGFGTWPCDEINYIWRHGNRDWQTDEFTPQMANPQVKNYVRRAFARVAQTGSYRYVVEKTCANSLRVEFVDRVVSDAMFIFIVRDGRDVVASAKNRWRASLDITYLGKKARYVPLADLPYYGLRYLKNRVHRLLSGEKRLASWGPRFEGMDRLLREYSLAEVCAMQWVRCVEKAEQGLAAVDPERVFRLRYEDFVANPAVNLHKCVSFVGAAVTDQAIQEAVQRVTAGNVGKWRKSLDQQTLELISPLIAATLDRYGYKED